jgi:hypothetical protein
MAPRVRSCSSGNRLGVGVDYLGFVLFVQSTSGNPRGPLAGIYLLVVLDDGEGLIEFV